MTNEVAVTDDQWPIGLVRAKLEASIKERLVSGWLYKGHSVMLLPTTSFTARVFVVFERATEHEEG